MGGVSGGVGGEEVVGVGGGGGVGWGKRGEWRTRRGVVGEKGRAGVRG